MNHCNSPWKTANKNLVYWNVYRVIIRLRKLVIQLYNSTCICMCIIYVSLCVRVLNCVNYPLNINTMHPFKSRNKKNMLCFLVWNWSRKQQRYRLQKWWQTSLPRRKSRPYGLTEMKTAKIFPTKSNKLGKEALFSFDTTTPQVWSVSAQFQSEHECIRGWKYSEESLNVSSVAIRLLRGQKLRPSTTSSTPINCKTWLQR